jgi:hypothetical protein
MINKFSGMGSLDEDLQAREAQRLYYASRLEIYEEQLKILRLAKIQAIDSEQYKQSPFMFGYVEGLRTALAFMQGLKSPHLKKPPVWHNDPAFEMLLRTLQAVRREMRRDITRLLWTLLTDERHIRVLLMAAMRHFPPVYAVRLERKRRIEASGANYEEVTNVKNIESWWA